VRWVARARVLDELCMPRRQRTDRRRLCGRHRLDRPCPCSPLQRTCTARQDRRRSRRFEPARRLCAGSAASKRQRRRTPLHAHRRRRKRSSAGQLRAFRARQAPSAATDLAVAKTAGHQPLSKKRSLAVSRWRDPMVLAAASCLTSARAGRTMPLTKSAAEAVAASNRPDNPQQAPRAAVRKLS
jgi:hypothetical protein